jgi:hypothetical protein
MAARRTATPNRLRLHGNPRLRRLMQNQSPVAWPRLARLAPSRVLGRTRPRALAGAARARATPKNRRARPPPQGCSRLTQEAEFETPAGQGRGVAVTRPGRGEGGAVYAPLTTSFHTRERCLT